jgi:hypothetical protein
MTTRTSTTMERAILLNNEGVANFHFGNVQLAKEKLQEALAVTKSQAVAIQQQETTDCKTSCMNRPVPTSENRAHTSMKVPGLNMNDRNNSNQDFFLCDQAMFITTDTFRSLRPTWNGEWQPDGSANSETITAHLDLMCHPVFVSTCSAIIIYNTALLQHNRGLAKSDDIDIGFLRNASFLYKMAFAIMLEKGHREIFQLTNSTILLNAGNNLIPILKLVGSANEVTEMLHKVQSVIRNKQFRVQMDQYIVQGIITNLMSYSFGQTAGAA